MKLESVHSNQTISPPNPREMDDTVKECDSCYPSAGSFHSDYKTHKSFNPLYLTSSCEIGSSRAQEHHRRDKYFPKTNVFSESFAGRNSRDAGLNTFISKSKVHKFLDTY